MLNVELTADARPVLDAVNCLAPVTPILRSSKVAIESTVALVVVPLSVPVPEESVIVTEATVETGLPKISLTATVMEGVIVTPGAASVGCCLNTS